MAAEVDQEKCTGCGLCVDACLLEAIRNYDAKGRREAAWEE